MAKIDNGVKLVTASLAAAGILWSFKSGNISNDISAIGPDINASNLGSFPIRLPSLNNFRVSSTSEDRENLNLTLASKLDEVLKKWPERQIKSSHSIGEQELNKLFSDVKSLLEDGYLDHSVLELSPEEIIRDLDLLNTTAISADTFREYVDRALSLRNFIINEASGLGLYQTDFGIGIDELKLRVQPLEELLKGSLGDILRKIPTDGYGSPNFLMKLSESQGSKEYLALPENLRHWIIKLGSKIFEDGERFKMQYGELSQIDPSSLSPSDYKLAVTSFKDFNYYKELISKVGLTAEEDISGYGEANAEARKQYLEGAKNAAFLQSKVRKVLGRSEGDQNNLFELLADFNRQPNSRELLQSFSIIEKRYLKKYLEMIGN